MDNNLAVDEIKEWENRFEKLNNIEFLDILYNELEKRYRQVSNKSLDSLSHESSLICSMQQLWLA